ncbi:MAG: hypothetical protein OJF50_006000 [Nitrospira sp.]|nr:hypothetical protein [Nitrospira sp.]
MNRKRLPEAVRDGSGSLPVAAATLISFQLRQPAMNPSSHETAG